MNPDTGRLPDIKAPSGAPVLVLGGCGYIGSALCKHLLDSGVSVSSVDFEVIVTPSAHPHICRDYRDIESDFLQSFEAVILLAAHSSVGAALSDPEGALDNNTVGFFKLLQKLGNTRLIYASSSSVYSGMSPASASEEDRSFRPTNMYDLTKHCSDVMAEISDVPAYGLRFGTVNGPSPNLRGELMINRMVMTALEKGCVEVSNPDAHRPILDICDLCRAIEAMLKHDGKPGLYNLASFNARIGEIAEKVAWIMDVPVIRQPDSPTYDFTVSSAKFESEYSFEFKGSIESIVADLLKSPAYQRSLLL
ncbi:MAG: SDR family oxidoreductase [Fimbriimonadaceae bacterium]|nr:SDR family oxidoreductase [Fimbriimonadaceae bacterium]